MDPLGYRLPDGTLRSGIDTAGSGPAVSLSHWGSVDITGWLVCVAIAELKPDTRGYSIEFGDGSAGTAARILSGDRVSAEAGEPLDKHRSWDTLVLGPRKLRTSDGQAWEAESYSSAPRRLNKSTRPSWPRLHSSLRPPTRDANPVQRLLVEISRLQSPAQLAEKVVPSLNVTDIGQPVTLRKHTEHEKERRKGV